MVWFCVGWADENVLRVPVGEGNARCVFVCTITFNLARQGPEVFSKSLRIPLPQKKQKLDRNAPQVAR